MKAQPPVTMNNIAIIPILQRAMLWFKAMV